MNPNMLAGILKNTYSSFNMSSFKNRLKIQKYVYLLQAFGLNIGYNYNYYLYGPYSTELTRDGYNMPKLKEVRKVEFGNKEDEHKFQKFIQFIKSHKDDVEWLEIAASTHFLRKQGMSHSLVLEYILKKHNYKFIKKTQLIKQIEENMQAEGML